MMKRNSKLLSVCSLLLAAVLSMGILVGCDSSDNNTDDDDEKEKKTTVTTTKNDANTVTTTKNDANTTTVTTDNPGPTTMKVAGSKDGVYTFRVPESWTVSAISDEMTMASSADTSIIAMLIIQENTEQYTSSAVAAQDAKSEYEQMYGSVEGPTETKLGGADSANITVTDDEGFVTTMVICVKDDLIYMLNVTSDDNKAVNTVCNQIQSAFTFE